jgi:tetratricopeptide (TPR) repeat protein
VLPFPLQAAHTNAMYVAGGRKRILPHAQTFAAILLLVSGLQCAPSSSAADNPGDALKRNFESAKSALAAGNLARAEDDYHVTIALALRQLGNLSISEQQFDRATVLLDEAVEFSPEDAALQVEDAIAWFRKGDANKATQIIQSVLRAHSDNARAHNVLGRLYLFNGDLDASIAELQKAVALRDDFETAYFLGIAFLRAKKTSETADLFAKLQAATRDSAALHVLFGRAYTITHFPEQAVAEFSKAVKLDPKYPRAHALLGYASLEFYGESNYPQARKLFEQELQIQPNDYLSLVLLGISTTSLRDYPAAETALVRATRLRPDGASPYLYLGETYSATGRFKEAVAALQKYVALVRTPQESNRNLSRGYFLLGQDLLRLGGHAEEARHALAHSQQLREAQFKYDQEHMFLTPDQQKARQELEASADALSLSSDRMAGVLEAGSREEDRTAQEMAQGGLPPGSSSSTPAEPTPVESQAAKQYRAFASEILAISYNDLGVMRAKNSQFAEAAELFKQAHAWNPKLPGLDRNYGFAAYRAELYAEAIPPLERQLAANPGDTFVRQLLGLSYFDQENYSKAAEVLRPFQDHPPDDPALLFAWGTALVRTRQSAEAAKIFQLMLQKNGGNPGVHYLLGQAYAQDKDYPNALSELKTAIRLDPKLSEAHYYTGLVYLHQSDFDNAAQEFRAELALRPGDPLTTYHLAFALLSQGQTEEAAALLRDVVKTKPDYELAHFELGRALLQQGDVDGAIVSLETARKLQPDRDITYFQLSQAYRRAGRAQDAEQALATYRKMIEASRQKKRQSLETETP